MELLLIEDDRCAQAIFAKAVDRVNDEMHNHLTCAHSLHEAREKSEIADCIFIDLGLPDAGPSATMQYVRDTCRRKAVVVFSSTDDEKIIAECAELGVGFITKKCFGSNQVDRLKVEIIRAQAFLAQKQRIEAKERERIRLLTESAKALGCNVQ